MADILLSTCPDGKLLFTALTESAEQWMGDTQVRLPTGLALDYETAAEADGLRVDAVVEWTEKRAAAVGFES
ncbi:MAG TPA: hypothetical protein VE224_14830 [Pseudolabrys sp.]|nr:hypothetical protein [Pseudolabrys sp.]